MDESVLAAEQGVLGALLVDNQSLYQLDQPLSAECFSQPLYRDAYEIAAGLIRDGEPADVVVVADRMRSDEALGELGTIVFNTVSGRMINHHADIVRRAADRRHLEHAMQEAHRSLLRGEPAERVRADLQGTLESAGQGGLGDARSMNQVMESSLDLIQEALERRQAGGVIGVPTGIPAIDQRTGGMHGPRVWCVAARPGIGKTALCNQIAKHGAKHGHAIGICSLEMGADELGIRWMANEYQLNGTKLALGYEDEIEQLSLRVTNVPDERRLDRLPIHLDTDTYHLDGIVARIIEWKRAHDIRAAFIDHIGLIEIGGDKSRNDQLGEVSRTFKKLAKRLQIPIVLVSQFNRSMEKERRRPKLSDLRDSGNIEQDIDIALFLHSENESEERDAIDVELGLLKNRGGRKGWLPEPVQFEGRTQTFREIDYRGPHA